MRTKDEMFTAISNWQMGAGEDFLDYFGANMNDFNFMFWCLGKGYINESQLQAFEGTSVHVSDYLIGEEVYSVVNGDSDDSYKLGYKILAEFLSTTITYQRRVDEFLKNIERINFDEAMKNYRIKRNKIFFEVDDIRTYLTKETPLTAEIISKAKWYRDNN